MTKEEFIGWVFILTVVSGVTLTYLIIYLRSRGWLLAWYSVVLVWLCYYALLFLIVIPIYIGL